MILTLSSLINSLKWTTTFQHHIYWRACYYFLNTDCKILFSCNTVTMGEKSDCYQKSCTSLMNYSTLMLLKNGMLIGW